MSQFGEVVEDGAQAKAGNKRAATAPMSTTSRSSRTNDLHEHVDSFHCSFQFRSWIVKIQLPEFDVGAGIEILWRVAGSVGNHQHNLAVLGRLSKLLCSRATNKAIGAHDTDGVNHCEGLSRIDARFALLGLEKGADNPVFNAMSR